MIYEKGRGMFLYPKHPAYLFNDTASVMYFPPYGGHGPVEGRGRRGRLYPIINLCEEGCENPLKSLQSLQSPQIFIISVISPNHYNHCNLSKLLHSLQSAQIFIIITIAAISPNHYYFCDLSKSLQSPLSSGCTMMPPPTTQSFSS